MPGILSIQECTYFSLVVGELRSLHFNLLLFELKIKQEELGITKIFVNNLRVRIFMYTQSATIMRVRCLYY